MFRSIRWRIAVTFIVLIGVLLAGLSAYLSHFLRESYQSSMRTHLLNEAALVGDSAAPYLVSEQNPTVNALAQRLGGSINSRVTIIDRSGVVLGDSVEDPSTLDNHLDRPEIIGALASGSGVNVRRSATTGYQMMYAAVPVTVDSQVAGFARVALPMTAVDAAMGRMNRIIILGSLAATGVAVAVGLQLARATVRPLKELTRLSTRIAAGELGQDTGPATRDEVGDLVRAFNQMSARLKDMVGALTMQRDTMAAVLATMEDGIFVVGKDGKIVVANASVRRLLHLSQTGVEGQTFAEAVRDYELEAILQRCVKSKSMQTGNLEFGAPKRILKAVAVPLDTPNACVLLIQDVSERRRLERTRRDFVANISHELRTPAASLKALAETLHDGALEDPEAARAFLGRMISEVDRLAQIIEELGELSRIESGEAPMQRAAFDLNEMIAEVASRMEIQAERAGLALSLNLAAGLPEAMGDRGRVEQVLVNLVHNAVKFTPRGGKVTISSVLERGMVRVDVADTGIGISTEDVPRVFERFYKVDRARSGGGTGLGLAIARHIVEAHGGRVWVESAEGEGSTFHFTLPLAPQAR